ncbi:unnamed protein product [Closterium sp. NIES-64]|nr:unnamed protein product [Closterium sp. NIES-64]
MLQMARLTPAVFRMPFLTLVRVPSNVLRGGEASRPEVFNACLVAVLAPPARPGTGGSGRGVSGRSVSGRSVSGRSVSGRGASGRSVSGRSVSGRGVSGRGVSGWGVSGRAMSLVPIASSLLPRPLPMPSCYIGVSFENSQPQALPINHLVPVHASSLAHFTCRLLVDLGMMGVMVHQQPMMPITFHVAPPGVTRSMSEELQEEEITACKQVGL